MGYTYQSQFLEAFPEVRSLIQKWANQNLDNLNCENVAKYIRNDVIPKIYNTYILEDCYDDIDPLSQQDFFKDIRVEKHISLYSMEVDAALWVFI